MNKLLLLPAALLALSAAAARAAQEGQLQDVVIKANDKEAPSAGKPAFDVQVDPYESLRATLKPDESLLLAESPALVSWARSRPQRLKDDRIIEPWNDALTAFSPVSLPVRGELAASLGREPTSKELKSGSWSASLVDEDGKPIRVFQGSGEPPESVAWDGLSDHGEWLLAGHAYSAVYKFSQSTAAARTVLGKPVQFEGLAHKQGDATLLSLDSSALFGVDRSAQAVAAGGRPLLRAAADWVRRFAFGSPLELRVFGPDADSARAQAAAAKDLLVAELGVSPDAVATESAVADSAEQRVELLVGRSP